MYLTALLLLPASCSSWLKIGDCCCTMQHLRDGLTSFLQGAVFDFLEQRATSTGWLTAGSGSDPSPESTASLWLGLSVPPSLSPCRALHWVTPQMLCVPINEEIQEVSDVVVKAITGMHRVNRLTPSPAGERCLYQEPNPTSRNDSLVYEEFPAELSLSTGCLLLGTCARTSVALILPCSSSLAAGGCTIGSVWWEEPVKDWAPRPCPSNSLL